MGERPPESDTDSDVGTPRWVKVFGILTVIIIVLVVVLLLIGGHNPSRHTGTISLGALISNEKGQR